MTYLLLNRFGWLCLLGLWLPLASLGQAINADIVVALDGSGDFTQIQDAIDAVPDNSSIPTVIYLKRGLYNTEKLIVPATKTNVVLIGESRDETIISYFIYDCQAGGFNGKCPAADAQQWSGDNIASSATLTVMADDFQAENLTIENTAGPVGQAQAITVRGDRVVFRNCNLTGYQDTIYLWSNGKRSYFEGCLIVGRTDYIYGGGTAFFQNCEIRSWGGGWITAPATAQNEPFGYVFNQCQLTYALNSPRAGDDGDLVRLGRPWQNYPKVAWLYCEMTDQIHPQGWGDTWNMPYAATSTDLHLYEYMNTGPGADMSGRAGWAGLRSLTAAEAANYTVQNVLGGSDGWAPSAVPPAVPTYDWTGAGATPDWRLADNWNPVAVPDTNEAAFVSGPDTLVANGGHFVADLNLSGYANLMIAAPCTVTYLALDGATLEVTANSSLSGRIRTKDSVYLDATADLDLLAEVIGVHVITKRGAGTLGLSTDQSNFSGEWQLTEGSVVADGPKTLGEARTVAVRNAASLAIETSDAIFTQTALRLYDGASLTLNQDISLLEFYINDTLMAPGSYSAATHPNLISGPGAVNVGRPTSYLFVGGSNGNWDNPLHFQPALLPEAGDTVYTDREMETTAFEFLADIYVQAGGRIRLRGTHRAAGTIYLEAGAMFAYATSGTGFTLDAPTVVQGEVLFEMNSASQPAHAMRLGGPISGEGKVTVFNRRDVENTGTVVLSGDNRGFTGIWDLTRPSGHPNSVAVIQGLGENTLGRALIEVGVNNLISLGNLRCAGDTLRVNLYDQGRIELKTETQVLHAEINGSPLADGTYDASTHPDFFVGNGTLVVGATTDLDLNRAAPRVWVVQRQLHVAGERSRVSVYDLSGRLLIGDSPAPVISLAGLPAGIYLVRYQVDGRVGAQRVLLQQER